MDSFENSDIKANISFAKVLGKIGIPAISHLVEFYHQSNDPCKESYALYALGKTMEIVVGKDLSTARRNEIFNLLFGCIADVHSTIRAKAIRALCKMDKGRLLTDVQRSQLSTACRRITGQDENYQWDRAFIVRKEAQGALILFGT
ncbi:hypothetical protein ACFL4K_00710 [Candidatus Neomarinimicrobiota bacterium]